MSALVHWDVCVREMSVSGRVAMLVLPCGACREYKRRDGTWREVNDAGDIKDVTCPACARIARERGRR